MAKFKIWLTLCLHLLAFARIITVQLGQQQSSLAMTQSEYWAAFGMVLAKNFATPAAQLVAVFLVVAPWWAVFITRKALLYGNLVWSLSLLWCGGLLFFIGTLKIQPWPTWFLYAALMLFLGLMGILYRVLRDQEKVETHYQED